MWFTIYLLILVSNRTEEFLLILRKSKDEQVQIGSQSSNDDFKLLYAGSSRYYKEEVKMEIQERPKSSIQIKEVLKEMPK